jgi:hypothetical protein
MKKITSSKLSKTKNVDDSKEIHDRNVVNSKTVEPKKESKLPKMSTWEMVSTAIHDLKKRNGSSRVAIAKYIIEKFDVEPSPLFNSLLRRTLKSHVEEGILKRNADTFKFIPKKKLNALEKKKKLVASNKKISNEQHSVKKPEKILKKQIQPSPLLETKVMISKSGKKTKEPQHTNVVIEKKTPIKGTPKGKELKKTSNKSIQKQQLPTSPSKKISLTRKRELKSRSEASTYSNKEDSNVKKDITEPLKRKSLTRNPPRESKKPLPKSTTKIK